MFVMPPMLPAPLNAANTYKYVHVYLSSTYQTKNTEQILNSIISTRYNRALGVLYMWLFGARVLCCLFSSSRALQVFFWRAGWLCGCVAWAELCVAWVTECLCVCTNVRMCIIVHRGVIVSLRSSVVVDCWRVDALFGTLPPPLLHKRAALLLLQLALE